MHVPRSPMFSEPRPSGSGKGRLTIDEQGLLIVEVEVTGGALVQQSTILVHQSSIRNC